MTLAAANVVDEVTVSGADLEDGRISRDEARLKISADFLPYEVPVTVVAEPGLKIRRAVVRVRHFGVP
jgi:hypothetical protein